MLHERFVDTWLLNLNLQSGLKLWKEHPDSEEYVKKISTSVRWGQLQDGLVIKIKKEVVNKNREEGVAITASEARNFGKEEQDLFVFESSRDVMPRFGFIKGRAFLMFDKAGGHTYAFLRPEDIESISSK